ncbi:MAG: Microtubule-associated serine/threonine-protein kinase 1, variant 2 [Marteilia pararefringens]
MSINANNGAQKETSLDNNVDKRVNKIKDDQILEQNNKMVSENSKAVNRSSIKEKKFDSNNPIDPEKIQGVGNKTISEHSGNNILPSLKWKGLSNRKHDIPNNLIERIEELNVDDSDQNKSMNRNTEIDKIEEHSTENKKPAKTRQKASSFKDLRSRHGQKGAQKNENSSKDDVSSTKIKSSNVGSSSGKSTEPGDQVTSSNKSGTAGWPSQYITGKQSRDNVDKNIPLVGPGNKRLPVIGDQLRIEVKKKPTMKGSKKTHGATHAKGKSESHTFTRSDSIDDEKVRHESRRGESEISLKKQLEMEEKAANKALEDSGQWQTVQSDDHFTKFGRNIDSPDDSREWRNYSSVECLSGFKKKPRGIMNSLKESLNRKAAFKSIANSHKKGDKSESSKQQKQSLASLEFLDDEKGKKLLPSIASDKGKQEKVADSCSGSTNSLKKDICKKSQASNATNRDKKSDVPIIIRGAQKEPVVPNDAACNLLLEKRFKSAPNLAVVAMSGNKNASQRSLDSESDLQKPGHIFKSVNDTLSSGGYNDANSPGSLASSGSRLDQGDDKGGLGVSWNSRSTGSGYRNNSGRNISINDRRKSYERLMDFSSRKYSKSRSRGAGNHRYLRYSEIKASYPRILGRFEKDLSDYLDHMEKFRNVTDPELTLWFKQLNDIVIACQNTIRRDFLDPTFINDIMCTIEQLVHDMSSANELKFEAIRPFFKRLSEVISAPARLVECLAVPYNDLYKKINCLQRNEPGQMLNFMRYLQSQTRNPFNFFDEKTSELIEKSDKHSVNLRETRHRKAANAAASERISIEDFKTIRSIRKGKFADIDLVQYKNTNIVCAMKTIGKKRFYFKNKIDKLFSERDIHVYLNSHFIANLFGTFTTHDRVCFVIEYISGGDLATYINEGFHFHHDKIRDFTAQLVLAINFLHSKEIVHRDLKPEKYVLPQLAYIYLH